MCMFICVFVPDKVLEIKNCDAYNMRSYHCSFEVHKVSTVAPSGYQLVNDDSICKPTHHILLDRQNDYILQYNCHKRMQ